MKLQPKALVTGVAGFIGFHLARRLLKSGYRVTGIDSVNDYYSQRLKRDRLKLLELKNFKFCEADICDNESLLPLFQENSFDCVFHLAGQAGVRFSINNPHAYLQANLLGFLQILECCRHYGKPHLVFASSSSVYGASATLPFTAGDDAANHPVSFYGATKKANEAMAHSYSAMYGMPVTGLRFFTVYGPWCRPDMALLTFAKAMLEGREILVFNNGELERDFTFVDDIVEALYRVGRMPPLAEPEWTRMGQPSDSSPFPFKLYNLGNQSPVNLVTFIDLIEKHLNVKALRKLTAMQAGDILKTFADSSRIEQLVGPLPKTSIETGVFKTMSWYLDYRTQNPDI